MSIIFIVVGLSMFTPISSKNILVITLECDPESNRTLILFPYTSAVMKVESLTSFVGLMVRFIPLGSLSSLSSSFSSSISNPCSSLISLNSLHLHLAKHSNAILLHLMHMIYDDPLFHIVCMGISIL